MSKIRGQSPTPTPPPTPGRGIRPSFADALRFWVKLGFISFGGPTGQIAIMHAELVEKRKWISNARFLHALNYCMLLPGPEAQQLATYIGWLLHRTRGGIVAGCLFVLPSVFILWLLSYFYVTYGDVPEVAAVFHGLKAAIVAIVAGAVFRIGKRALRNGLLRILAVAAFTAIHFFGVPFPVIIVSAAIAGWLGARYRPDAFVASADRESSERDEDIVLGDESSDGLPSEASWPRAARVTFVCVLLWWAPILAAGLFLGWNGTHFREGVFFSKAALVTFGGAYAVLPYVAQQAVQTYGWLGAEQMMDGLGLAETTPGPLIMVVQFVGFVAAWNHPGSLSPLMAATLGALLVTWVTFVPCFLWIFLGAPHIERLRGNTRLAAALAAVTAAVVGVILNLAVWFGVQVAFPDGQQGIDGFAVILTSAVFIGMLRWKWEIIHVIVGAALAGFIHYWIF